MAASGDAILTLSNAITVRPLRPSDAEALSSAANNPKIAQNLTDRFPHPYTLEDASSWIKYCNDSANYIPLKLSSPGSGGQSSNDSSIAADYGVCLADVVIGTTGLMYDRKTPRAITLGYWIAEAHWGKGVATILATAFSNWVFDTFDWVVRIDADAYSWNVGSQKVLAKAGFVYEGRQKWKACKNGKFGDLVLFGKTRSGVELEEFQGEPTHH